MADTEQWKCPGHGTPVEKDGKYYFLYHAYDRTSGVYTGREGLLQEFRFTPDGWIEMVQNNTQRELTAVLINDKFKGSRLMENWQWSVFQKPIYTVKRRTLQLQALPVPAGAFLGQKTYTGNYEATVRLRPKTSSAATGIGAIGDDNNTVSAVLQNGTLRVMQLRDGKDSLVAETKATGKRNGFLQMQVRNGKDMTFLYSADGRDFTTLNATPVDGSFLPPWDRAVRVGLISKGTPEQKAVFKTFRLNSH
jgi:beta-xylosidase